MKKERKRLYEGMYIINANLSEEARNKALEKIVSAIEEKQGELHKTIDMGKKKLAYQIGKKKEGYYYLLYFTIDASKIEVLWKEYHLNEDLIRFLTFKTDEVKENLEFKSLIQER